MHCNMAAKLLENLHDLHDCITGDVSQDSVESAHNIIGDIGNYCLQDVRERDVDYCCSLLFNKDNGVVTFLKKTVTQDKLQDGKAELLRFLQTFTDTWGTKVLPYAVDIKDACISLFTRDKYSKVKNQVIPLLISIVQLTASSKMAEELKIQPMIEKFFMELTRATKHTATVKQNIFHLLGVLAEVYPEHMVSYSERLLELYVRTLKTEMTTRTRKPEMPVISGCLQGMKHLLVSFPLSSDEGAKHSYDIYKYARMAMDPSVKHTRFEMPKTALDLLAAHAPQFNQYLLDEYGKMYEILSYWGSHHNNDAQRAGMYAMEAFLNQVARMLVTRAQQGRKEPATFKFFIQNFRSIMDNPDAKEKEVAMAIKGYGFFAAPCRIFLTPEDVKFMLNEMIQRSEQIYLGSVDIVDDKMFSLPSFLDALASIVREIDEVSETFVLVLERLLVLQIENYPKLSKKVHTKIFKAILKVLVAMSNKGAVFKGFLNRVVYQGVIRTCSRKVVLVTEDVAGDDAAAEAGEDDEDGKKLTYKDYLTLWRALLEPSRMGNIEGMTVVESQTLSRAVYDELISVVLSLIQRLDLTSARADQPMDTDAASTGNDSVDQSAIMATCDPVQGLHATKPKDFIIFINLVAFSKDILEWQRTELFAPWVFTFGHELILHATKYPLVSGFYKLLAVCMKICTRIKYFKGLGGEKEASHAVVVSEEVIDLEEDMEIDLEPHSDLVQREASFLLFSKFTKEVLTRMKQYKEELLAACLILILSLPQEIVIMHIHAIVPALKVSLKIGQSYLLLASAGLNAIEHWSRVLPPAVLNPYYREILPCLDAYLKTVSVVEEDKTITFTSTSSKRTGKQKIPVKLLKAKKEAKNKYESQLNLVKQRCVFLLGSLGGTINHCLVTDNAEEVAKAAVAWDTQQHLKYDMPFQDIKPVIYFDNFLPRIVELATSSSERQTKVAACELLHSMVLYALGRGSTQPGSEARKESLEPLYRRLFPFILQLACDVDQVARELFEPLMMQLIHWFTSNKAFESRDTMALLDSFMDGVVSPTDTALRDFSARCIHEFLKWSIKHISKKKMESSSLNVKSVLKRLFSLARHPSAFKRLGAALAFNNIYTIFREEESLVDMFAFQILTAYIDSLALAHEDDKSLGTVEQCRQVLRHMERIIKAKADLLSSQSKIRAKVRGWAETTLIVCLKWLMRQCGRPQTECRHACMHLLYNLAPSLTGVKSTQGFFSSFLNEIGPKYFIQRFETGIYKVQKGRSGLAKYPSIQSMGSSFSIKQSLAWFDILLATLDCYNWTFGQQLLSPSQVFIVSDNVGTSVFVVLNHFTKDISQADIYKVAKLFEVKLEENIFTPKEIDDFNRGKCTVIVRIIMFLVTMLHSYKKESLKVIPGSLWSESLWDMIISCVLTPASIGFNMGDIEIMMNLPQEVERLLHVLSSSLPSNILQGFKTELNKHLQKKGKLDVFGMLPVDLSKEGNDYMTLRHLVQGYLSLQKCGLLLPGLAYNTAPDKLAESLVQSVFSSVVTKSGDTVTMAILSPTSQDLGKEMLQLAFSLGIKPAKALSYLLDKNKVKNTSKESYTHQGALFYATFKHTLNSNLVSMAGEIIPELGIVAGREWSTVGTVLAGMLDHVSRDRQLRRKEGGEIIRVVSHHWKDLRSWWGEGASNDMKTQALVVLTKAIMVDSKIVSDVSLMGYQDIFDMYRHLLTDKKTSLVFKNRVLDLLPFFAALPDKQTSLLKETMDRVVADQFPLKSDEFALGSPKYNDYITALNKILAALELSGSFMLLELLLSIMCREKIHVHEEAMQTSLARFVHRLPLDKHKPALDVAYKIFTSESGFPHAIRQAALERVCISMLRLVSLPALTEFFLDHIKDIMASLQDRLLTPSDVEFEGQLISKLCNMELLEVMYSRLPKAEVNTKDSRITNVYCDGKVDKGNELTTAVIKVCNAAKSEDIRGETELLELRRQYHCAAYNTLIAAVSCTQTEAKFYNAFLFSDNPAKGQFLFENLVDANRKYTFAIEMERRLERMKKFVSIRKEVQEGQSEGSMSPTDDSPGRSRSIHYLASYLADSSLSTDVSQFDFGTSAATVPLGGSGGSYKSSKRPENLELELEPTVMVKDDYVEMEMDELNQHECMASLTALLQHMVRNNISPEPDKGTAVTSMPQWMDNLQKKMTSESTDGNTRLFLAKLIINAQEVFRPYAKFWFSPLVQLIVSGQTGSPGIHYLVVDLVVTMLSWHTVAIPENTPVEKAMASRLFSFLVSNCHHESRQVLRNNLQVLKTLVEVWRDRIQVPYGIIYEKFHQGNSKSQESATGVQILGVILANKLPPYSPEAGVDKERYFQHLAMNMSNEYMSVYAPAAEVVGMALQYMSEREKQDSQVAWRNLYLDNIEKMLRGILPNRAKGMKMFITCVYKMRNHYTPAADKFVSQMLFLLPNVHGEFKTMSLEVIHAAVDKLENPFLELKNAGIAAVLEHRHEETQQVALKLVLSLLSRLKSDELLYLLPSVAGYASSPSATCRGLMYDIFMWIYDSYREEDSEQANQIMTTTKDCLLKGLSDDDLKNKLSVQNFWSHETRLPSGTVDRLVAMLEAMYTPATESQYLSYATNLILEMTSKSPDYNKEVFEYPLSDCNFVEYNVKSSWRQRHTAMTPLFVETQASQSQANQSMSVDDSLGSGQIRATQDVANFTPTQNIGGGGGKGPYNWLTQSSFDTYSDVTLPSLASDTQSGLLFSIGKAPAKIGYKPAGPNFGRTKLKPTDTTDGGRVSESQENDILRLKRRFIRSSEQKTIYFAKQQIRLNKMREEILKEQRNRRENQVTMYRKYRIGDLPDIQIKNSYIIAPLQALAQRDNMVARLLFSSVFKAIFAKVEMVKAEREARETVEKISSSLNAMLNNSAQYVPAFIASVLDIAHAYPRQLQLDAGAVKTACLTSLQQPMGILLLEERLLQAGDEEERPSKRARGANSNISVETSTWIEMTRLYKSLGQFDVLQGIFSNKIGTKSLTREAMEAEMRGDFQEAVRKYNQGLSCMDWEGEEPDDVEQDLWDESRLQCYMRLTQWDNLRKYTEEAIDDHKPARLDRVWTDAYYQEHYLNPLIVSKLKCLLEGEEQQNLLSFVDKALLVPEHKALLETRYCEELALLYLWQEDYDRARFYSSRAVEAFLQDWGSLDNLMVASRTSVLQKLQKLVEMQEFLKFMSHEENLSGTVEAGKLVDRWLLRKPHPIQDSTLIWDDVITNRCVYIEKVCDKLEAGGVAMETGDAGMEQKQVMLRLMQADSARQQDNFSVAMKLIRNTKDDVKRLKDNELQIKWSHTYARTHQRRCQMLTSMELEDRVKTLAGVITHLDSQKKNKAVTSSYMVSSEHSLLRGTTIQQLITLMLNSNLEPSSLSAEVNDKLSTVASCSSSDNKQLVKSMMQIGFKDMKQGLELSEKVKQSEEISTTDSQNAYMALFKYCDSFLRIQEDDEKLEGSSTEEFPETMVATLLSAMKAGSAEARSLFPRLLQLADTYPATRDPFIHKSGEVASWMFLDWLGQMTALLDKPESPVVHDILFRIANDYPEALIYAFKISVEGYKFDKSSDGKRNQDVCEQLSVKLAKVKMVDSLITSLEQFGQPNALFRDWYEGFGKLLKQPKRDEKLMRKEWQEMLRDLLDPTTASEEDLYAATQESSSLVLEGKVMGKYRRKFAQEYYKKVEAAFGKNGEKLMKMNYKDFSEKCAALRMSMDNEARQGKMTPPGTLKEYSMWLSNFQAQDYDTQLELPGQYTGKSKPLPEYHVKIASFDERVKVMESIRKPKCIIIRGNDAKDYRFLVKGGEDLRQDQRIEQLFAIMNDVFQQDAACSQRHFHLRTYQVIPMTTRVGMIEWMEQTMPLKDKLESTMTDAERQAYYSKRGPSNQQNEFMKGASKEEYYSNYKNVNRSNTEKAFKNRERLVPWDLLRRAYQEMSASPEAYFTLRSNFAVSHAVLCVCHYILGIGDRHLSNFMIDLKTGCSIGIDFGHAFASATQILPIPELMPIRLTRQIRNLMMPLQEKGLLEGSMIHALRALRNNSDLLLATMDVFIKEPSLDWQQNEERQRRVANQIGLVEEGEQELQWYPKQKVAFAKRKLQGDNPAYITRDDLQLNPSLKKDIQASITKVALGDKSVDIRAKLPAKGLTVEQQVACLLNQATDANILGRTWVGWAPFM